MKARRFRGCCSRYRLQPRQVGGLGSREANKPKIIYGMGVYHSWPFNVGTADKESELRGSVPPISYVASLIEW